MQRLTANVELGQTRPDGYVEQPMVTLGADIDGSRRLAGLHPAGWSARDALQWLMRDHWTHPNTEVAAVGK